MLMVNVCMLEAGVEGIWRYHCLCVCVFDWPRESLKRKQWKERKVKPSEESIYFKILIKPTLSEKKQSFFLNS